MSHLLKKPLILLPLFAGLCFFGGCLTDDDSDDDGDTTPTSSLPALPDGQEYLLDKDIEAGESLTLDAATVYIISGFVFVEEGATLTIPAGTVLKGMPGGGLNASALIVCRGATININGTAASPVIMTAQADDLSASDDLGPNANALWGGLIVLGKATTNRADGENQIEGIDPTDSRGLYGGIDDADNSGTITYLSIRYGGTNIGEGNEINGLTMGSVGTGTTINHVEVYNNADDGFEWFGGTVNTTHLASINNQDDSFDWDEGFRGKGQFWLVLQGNKGGDRAVEGDGSAKDNFGNSVPSEPMLYNVTFIGSGLDSKNNGNMAFKLREETGVHVYNSIFTHFVGDLKLDDAGAIKYLGVVNFDDEKGTNKVSARFDAGKVVFKKNMFHGFPHGMSTAAQLMKFSSFESSEKKTEITEYMAANNDFGVDPMLTSITRDDGDFEADFDPRPAAGSPALSGAEAPTDGFFENVPYRGAFSETDNWLAGWSFADAVY